MTVDELASLTLPASKINKSGRKSRDATVDAEDHQNVLKKRKVDEVEETDDGDLSRKEKKKLRRLAKEKKAAELQLQSKLDSSQDAKKERKRSKHKDKKGVMETTEERQQQTMQDLAMVSTPSTSANSTKDTTPVPPSASYSDTAEYLSTNRITIHTPPNEAPTAPVLTFDQLNVPSKLRDALLNEGFSEPTPIQASAWPALIKGKDVVGVAETGSGKTLAFGIPAFAKLIARETRAVEKHGRISVLVVSPTRELAIQTCETLDAMGRSWGLRALCVYGGVGKDSQREELQKKRGKSEKIEIVVGTPGRLLDFAEEGCLDLSRVTYLVLDEADRMLDRGFENDITKIINRTAKERQTVMFSATWPESVRRLAASFQQNPIRIMVGNEDLAANSRIEQVVEVFDDPRSKDSRLFKHLKSLLPKNDKSSKARILVFALYKLEASRLTQTLERNGYSVCSLHGSLSQTKRIEALEDFKSGKTRLMVATDVASRGLDIPEVQVVINYTFPLTVEDYVHRIGRTGRGGRDGKSITFFTGENHERGLAGEFAKVLRESGFECEDLKKFPLTIKKKEHSAYGAFFKETSGAPVAKKIRF